MLWTRSLGAAPNKVDLCKDSRVTGIKYIDDSIEKCCLAIKSSDPVAMADAAGECVTRGVSSAAGASGCLAAGAALGPITGGASTAVGALMSPLCGKVAGELGAFVYNRVAGYNAGQLLAGGIAGAACGVVSGGAAAGFCFFVAAELAGWISDTLGPVIEGIFDPGAANRREQAARAAVHQLMKKTREAREAFDEQYRLLWAESITSIKDTYKALFKTASAQATAKKILGFGPTYDEIAKAFVASGATPTPANWSVFAAFLDYQKRTGGPGCANLDRAPWDSYSAVCPFMAQYFYDTMEEAWVKSGDTSRASRIAFEERTALQLDGLARSIWPNSVKAISDVVSRVAGVAIYIKQKEIAEQIAALDRAKLAIRASGAAAYAEDAAKRALRATSSQEAQRLVDRAKNKRDIAVAAYEMLLDSYGKRTTAAETAVVALLCARDDECKKAAAAAERAEGAAELAEKNATISAAKRYAIGAAIVAGIAGGVYYFTRKN